MSKKIIGDLMKEVQRMQSEMARIQEEVKNKTVEASAGGGMVTAVANGAGEILSIKIEKEVVNPNDIEMLQDLVVAAINEALKRSREMMEEEMSKLTGGIKLPDIGGLGNLFGR